MLAVIRVLGLGIRVLFLKMHLSLENGCLRHALNRTVPVLILGLGNTNLVRKRFDVPKALVREPDAANNAFACFWVDARAFAGTPHKLSLDDVEVDTLLVVVAASIDEVIDFEGWEHESVCT